MKTFYLYTHPSGIRLIEGDKMPVKDIGDIQDSHHLEMIYKKRMAEIETYLGTMYIGGDALGIEKRLRSIVGSAHEVQNKDAANALIANSKYEGMNAFTEGRIYGPFEGEYEKTFKCCDNNVIRQGCFYTCNKYMEFAILTPDPPKESQESDPYAEVIRLARRGPASSYNEIKEKFTITRKP